MGNTLLTISMITREALMVLENNLTFTKHVRRDFDENFGVAGAKIGTILNIRKPPKYVGRTGQGIQIEDATETQVPLALNTQRGVDLAFTSADLALSIDDFRERFINPAVANVANGIDYDGMQQYLNVYNMIGTPGVTPNALLTYLQAGQRLNEEACPRDADRALVISPASEASIVDALKGLFQASTEIEEQYKTGKMGLAIGFKWSMDQNVGTQVFGALGGAPVVNGANQTGSSLITNGWTGAVATRLNAGDVITVGTGATGCYAIFQQSRASTGALRNFLVTANTASDINGNMTIPIYPAITPAGPFQTVVASPANGAVITPLAAANTSSPQSMAFHKTAFAMGCADLPLPKGVDLAARVSDKKLGCSIRLVRAYDINTDRFPCRLDILYGWVTLYPELACRVAG